MATCGSGGRELCRLRTSTAVFCSGHRQPTEAKEVCSDSTSTLSTPNPLAECVAFNFRTLPRQSVRTYATVSDGRSGAEIARAPCCRRPARPTSPPTSRPFGPSCSRRRGPAAVRRREARRPAGRSSRPGRGISRATEAHGRNNGGFLGLRRTGIWWCRGWRGRRGACPSRRSPVSQRRRRPVVSKEEGVREEQDQEQEEEQEEGAGARGGRRREKPEVQSHRLAAFRPVARASEPPASGGGGGRGGGGGVGAEAENGGGRDGGGEGGRGG